MIAFTYEELTPEMPGEFLVTTASESRYIVVNGPGPTSAFCRLPGFPAPSLYGDGEWIWCTYERAAVGEQFRLSFTRDERERPLPPSYVATWRTTELVVEIAMYLGAPAPPSDIWDAPWWDVA